MSSTIPTSESVIRVFNIPAITWTLTLFLLAGGTYYIRRAIRSRRTTDRINHALHALMHTLMAAMLWNAIPSTTLVQIAVLAAATLWFIIQAVARPQFRTFCAGTQDRLKCLYHSLTMAAAALMIAMMAIPGAATTGAGATGHATAGHNHHAMSGAPATGAAFNHTPAVAIILTVLFGTAAAVFLVLFLRRHQPTRTKEHHTTRRTSRTDHALEATGAAIMAIMFATMTA
ncbi:DUF5134 domain-containing protein [Arthrobacter sp. 18067]|uniref:DUF5134 domain-containing protein n=1 Tax=Arthrobacter sp. 18067 TaxID=2681413 RepID=UPI00135C1A2A|nr:DUF5134 domain-containing protein [Arthrobacter sp. 18067]